MTVATSPSPPAAIAGSCASAGQREAQRPPLRCLDWRFLLPDPPAGGFDHLVLRGGPPGLAELIVAQGLARRVSDAVSAERSADALIVLRGATVDLGLAAGCLRPGGVLYREMDRRLPGALLSTRGRLRRRLAPAGLSLTGLYWMWPDGDQCSMYLPLDVRAPLRWHVSARLLAPTPARWLARAGLRVLARAGAGALAARCWAVTAIAGPAEDRPLSILGHPGLPAELRRPGLRPLVLTLGGDDLNRVVVLPFADGEPAPAAVLKLSRLPVRNVHVENEQAVLADIRRRLDEGMRRTAPEPLGAFAWNGLTVGVESYVPGPLLALSTCDWGTPLRRKVDGLLRATDWLIEFHRQAQLRWAPWGQAEIQCWVEEPLAAYVHAFGAAADERRLFDAVRGQASALIGRPLPVVWEHYAFNGPNILSDQGVIRVVDWEGGGVSPPLLDMLFLATRWIYDVRNLSDEAGQRRAFLDLYCGTSPADPVIDAARGALRRYVDALGIDGRFLPVLLVLGCVVHATSRRERLGELSDGDATGPRAANEYVAFVGLLAEHRARLFEEEYGWWRARA